MAEAKHLLIVDDEKVILDILRTILSPEPLRLTLAASFAEARRVIQTDPVNLLLTDKNLPDGSGLDLVRQLKAADPIAEAIIITGFPSLDSAISAIELDVYDYVPKPFRDVFEIRRKVRQASSKQDISLENRRLLQELKEKNMALEAALAETQALQAELIQSEKLAGIGTLAAGIAHEISSPLFGVMGMAEAIAEEDDLPLAQGYARDIVEYCRQIRDIVVELSSYSRSSAHEYLTTVELSKVVADALKLVERSAVLGPVAFTMQVESGLYLHARTNELQQVFVNLIKNAGEAVYESFGDQDGGQVFVEAGRNDNYTWIRVRDNGPGIPEEKQRLVFDPFYTTKAPGKGTGLGLNIVWRIVTRYRGTIQVQSKDGQGTTFELRFPVDK
jgi:C4-dicarboxylate-specific signal transduction histidine kinase